MDTLIECTISLLIINGLDEEKAVAFYNHSFSVCDEQAQRLSDRNAKFIANFRETGPSTQEQPGWNSTQGEAK